MRTNVDEVTKAYGVKHVFIESGKYAILNKVDEFGDDFDIKSIMINGVMPTYYCQFSWGCGDEEDGDIFDAGVASFGSSVDDAIQNCIKDFESLVKEDDETYVEIAKHFNIYHIIKML
jgi:hypothetical protein